MSNRVQYPALLCGTILLLGAFAPFHLTDTRIQSNNVSTHEAAFAKHRISIAPSINPLAAVDHSANYLQANAFIVPAKSVLYPTIVAHYWAWGITYDYGGLCAGGDAWGLDPDFLDLWFVDDEDNHYFTGHTHHFGYFTNYCMEEAQTYQDSPIYQHSNCQFWTCTQYYGGYIQSHVAH